MQPALTLPADLLVTPQLIFFLLRLHPLNRGTSTPSTTYQFSLRFYEWNCWRCCCYIAQQRLENWTGEKNHYYKPHTTLHGTHTPRAFCPRQGASKSMNERWQGTTSQSSPTRADCLIRNLWMNLLVQRGSIRFGCFLGSQAFGGDFFYFFVGWVAEDGGRATTRINVAWGHPLHNSKRSSFQPKCTRWAGAFRFKRARWQAIYLQMFCPLKILT